MKLNLHQGANILSLINSIPFLFGKKDLELMNKRIQTTKDLYSMTILNQKQVLEILSLIICSLNR